MRTEPIQITWIGFFYREEQWWKNSIFFSFKLIVYKLQQKEILGIREGNNFQQLKKYFK
jgi:hypothetical protein